MVSTSFAPRPRSFLRVSGPDAASFLERLLSNEVESLGVGQACDALLLTPKARVIAPLRVLRRGADDFLLLTEPELGDVVARQLLRFRLASKADVEPEAHQAFVLLGTEEGGLPVPDYGVPAVEILDERPDAPELGPDELERLRIRAGTPRFGREIDDRVLPAEAGLVERAVSFTKGCYPGQEPIARLHYRGQARRRLRVLELDADEVPAYDAEVRYGEKAVGRITSAVRDAGGRIVALGYVRTDVPEDAELAVSSARARIRA